jgi:hypothetical protein
MTYFRTDERSLRLGISGRKADERLQLKCSCLSLEVRILPPGGLSQIFLADDIVTVENAPGLVPRGWHGHPFGSA